MINPSGPDANTPAFIAPPGGTFLGHPRGLFLLFLVEMWERFSYYGMRGLLILYLTAAVAIYQLAPGTYTNTLQVEQTLVPSPEEKKAKVEHPVQRQTIQLSGTVGGPAPAPAPAFGEAGPLKFERLTKSTDPKAGDDGWVPTGKFGLEGLSFAVDPKNLDATEPVRFKVTNPTDRKVKLTFKALRPMSQADMDKAAAKAVEAAKKDGEKDEKVLAKIEKDARETADENYKVYFKYNDTSGVASTDIRPDSQLGKDKPFTLTVDINRVDSGRSWTKATASTLYGWYTGMAYLLPILGGLIADKLVGTHRSMVVGALLITLGHIVLGISGIGSMALSDTGMTVFVFGLALITLGTGHFKPSVSVMVGQLYPLGDPRRESAFSIFYMGINLGSFLCNIACGALALNYGWHYGFGAAAVGMIAGLITYLIGRPSVLGHVGESDSPHKGKAGLFLPIGILLSAGIAALYHIGILKQFDAFASEPFFVIPVGLAALAYAVYIIASQEPGDRGPVATIFVYMLFNALFWLAFEQAGSSLNTFTDEQTDRNLLGSEVPTTFFQSINPLLIIIFAPIAGLFWASLARKKTAFPQPFKIGTGLIFVGLGYVVMVFAGRELYSGIPKVTMMYICGTYFLHTVGEIILSPTGLSYVAKTAPAKSMSSLMGIWFISSFIAGLAAGKVSALVDPIIEGEVKLPWNLGGSADFFLLFVITSCGAGLLIIAVGFFLAKLQRNPQD